MQASAPISRLATQGKPMPAPCQPHRRKCPTVRRALLTIAGLLVAMLVVATLALTQLARAKTWVNGRVSEATGRHFEIQGDLRAALNWPQPLEQGWRRWIPGVTLQAEKLVMHNPPGVAASSGSASARTGHVLGATSDRTAPEMAPAAQTLPPIMARADKVTASIALWPLLVQRLSVRTVALNQPEIALVRDADGIGNWHFKPRAPHASPSTWTIAIDQVQISNGALSYADPAKKLSLQAQVYTLPTQDAPAFPDASQGPNPAPSASALASVATVPASGVSAASGTTLPARRAPLYGIRFEVQGRYQGAQVQGTGLGGQVISLGDSVIDYPLQFALKTGSVAFAAEGHLANPRALSGLDFDVELRGKSMADLYEVTGLVLPSTPPFQTRGHLTGSLEPERAVWKYSQFDGKVGQSDLHGDVQYTSDQPRPRLQGSMTSNQLRLADLGPTLGTHGTDSKRPAQRAGKILPDSRFAAERWNAMDMDITFEGKQIIRSDSLPLENLSVRAVMNDAQLRLAPLTFGVAEGQIESTLEIDGRTAPLKAQIHGSVQGLKLAALFPKVALMQRSLGRMDGAIALESHGNTLADLLGHGTGEMRLYVREGVLSQQLLELAALNVGSIVIGRLFGEDQEVRLRCAVAEFTVQQGLARTRIVKMSTDEAVVEATGTTDLGSEKLDLRIKPESLEWKFFSLRTPLYVRGTFSAPEVGIEPGPLLLRAGAVVAAAVAAPAALALVPITVPAADDDTHCKPLLDLARQPVRAGKSGASGEATKIKRDAAMRTQSR